MMIVAPLGVLTAIYLEEVAAKSSRFAKFVSASNENLAGTPSIVFGLVGFAVLVRGIGMGPSVLAGALTLAVVVFPIVTIFTQEALRSVPPSLREASAGLGSDPWQTTFRQVLPRAWPRIVTGLLLAASRALGETAPLVVVGAAYYVTTLPHSILGGYTVLPLQVYNWSSDPRRGFHADAAAATLVLVAILFFMNIAARGIAKIKKIDRTS
jgi:phosphate transport system permease protein